jgi:hypothetical protein
MTDQINIGDRVRVNVFHSKYDGMKGEVRKQGHQYDWRVDLDDLKFINTAGFDSNELDKYND